MTYPLRRLSLPVFLFSSSLIAPSQAAENKEEDLVVVSATRSTTDIKRSPRTLSVISRQTLDERSGLTGIQPLLAEIPGIQFVRSGGLGGQIMMRGFNSNEGRMVFAIDGDRYEGRNTLQFNMVDPDAIERIEVIRGPASALYGSDAMTGVINIVTRRASVEANAPFELTPHIRSMEWNSGNNMYGGRAELSGGGDGFDLMLGTSYRHADDYDTPIGKARNSDSQSKAVDFNVGFRPDELSRWELSGRFVDVDTGRAGGLGAAPGYPTRLVSETPIIERYLRAKYESQHSGWLADSWEATLYRREFQTDIYQLNQTRQGSTLQHLKVYSPVVWGGHLTAQNQLSDHALSYGGDFWYSDTKGRTSSTTQYNKSGMEIKRTNRQPIDRDTSTFSAGTFVNDNWAISDTFTLNGALRGDMVQANIGDPLPGENQAQRDAFGKNARQRHYAVTGSLGGVWQMTPDWHLVANLSRGFHAASAQSLVLTSVAGTVPTLPNPDLKPETNITAEAGIRWYGNGHQATLTAWQSNYDDLIFLTPVGNNLWQRQNVAKAKLRGIELEGQSLLTETLSARYSLATLWGENSTTHKPLPAIAPLTGTFALRYDRQNWYSEVMMQAWEGRSRIDKKAERTTAGYAMFNVYVGGHLDALFGERFSDWKLVGGVENLFDTLGRNPTASENISLPQSLGNPLVEPGRAFTLKLTVDY